MHERAENAERHVPLRIARFERRGRGGVEADVREEDDRGALHDAAPAEVAVVAGVRRDVRMPVRGVDELQPGEHEHDDDADLQIAP